MRCLVVGAMLLLSLGAYGRDMREDAVAGERPLAQSALRLMSSKTATRLEILYYPTWILTRTALSPERLEKLSSYRISIRAFQDAKLRDDLISALERSAVKTTTQSEADYRWACIFYNADGTRLLTMYFDGFGTKGLINGAPVTSIGPVVKCLERRCSGLWR